MKPMRLLIVEDEPLMALMAEAIRDGLRLDRRGGQS
jgi:hypothetical protein